MTEAPGHLDKPAPSALFGDGLRGIDSEAVAALISSAADVALVIDGKGIIKGASFGAETLAKESFRSWVGRPWIDTVTIESRPKIEDLLRQATFGAASRWRQVNHPVEEGQDVPIRYSAVRSNPDGTIVAVGRDLRAMAAVQRRLAEAQQAMEREYARIRAAEKRYRLLFQLTPESVLIVDAANHRIVEANPKASAFVGREGRKIAGQPFDEIFDEGSRHAVQSFTAALQVAPRVDNVHVRLATSKVPVLLSGALFRQEGASHFLVLMSQLADEGGKISADKASLLQLTEKIPDAVVVTDMDRRISAANAAFLDLIQVATEDQARGELLDRWIGRAGVDLDILTSNLRQYGTVRQFSTVLHGEYGANEDIEIAAATLAQGTKPELGFILRGAGWRSGPEKLGGRQLPRTVEQFTELVGRVPLKNLVRETTDIIERLCIEAALELTRDNRASAADMLGLSRQGLYAKLRRYGLGDLGTNDPD